MSLNANQAKFLQRLVEEKPARRRSDVAEFFAAQYGIGKLVGREVIYALDDWERAAQFLDNLGIARRRLDERARRAETIEFSGISEKSFGQSPHRNSVAVKAAFGDSGLGGSKLFSPDGGYLVLTVEDAIGVQCERLLVVENLETFRNLAKYRWIDYQGMATLAIYRGERLFNTADAGAVIEARSESVVAFVDFDPAGLAIANRLPRLERLLIPDLAWLRAAVGRTRRSDLFDKQVAQSAASLEAAAHPDICGAWAAMKELRRGFPQEWMEGAPCSGTFRP